MTWVFGCIFYSLLYAFNTGAFILLWSPVCIHLVHVPCIKVVTAYIRQWPHGTCYILFIYFVRKHVQVVSTFSAYGVLDTKICDQIYQLHCSSLAGFCSSWRNPFHQINKHDRHDITYIYISIHHFIRIFSIGSFIVTWQ
jgi:hypothetical protein